MMGSPKGKHWRKVAGEADLTYNFSPPRKCQKAPSHGTPNFGCMRGSLIYLKVWSKVTIGVGLFSNGKRGPNSLCHEFPIAIDQFFLLVY